MISIITKWWHIDGKGEEAVTALKKLVLETRKHEPDTYMYCLHTSIVEGSLPPPTKNEIIFLGAWKDRKAFDDHRNGPVFTTWLKDNIHLFVRNDGGLYVSAEFADRFAGFIRKEAIG